MHTLVHDGCAGGLRLYALSSQRNCGIAGELSINRTVAAWHACLAGLPRPDMPCAALRMLILPCSCAATHGLCMYMSHARWAMTHFAMPDVHAWHSLYCHAPQHVPQDVQPGPSCTAPRVALVCANREVGLHFNLNMTLTCELGRALFTHL